MMVENKKYFKVLNKKYHFVYRTTCLVTGKFYIGMHSTDNLDDGYLGSGRLIFNSIKKYGKDNHFREILEFSDDRISLIEKEKNRIEEFFKKDTSCMNLSRGGFNLGGTEESKLARSKKGGQSAWKRDRNKMMEICRQRGLNAKLLKIGIFNPNNTAFKGKKHKQETKDKISKANSISQRGERNSQFGTMWINNGTLSKKIKKHELIPSGWFKGRKIKNNGPVV